MNHNVRGQRHDSRRAPLIHSLVKLKSKQLKPLEMVRGVNSKQRNIYSRKPKTFSIMWKSVVCESRLLLPQPAPCSRQSPGDHRTRNKGSLSPVPRRGALSLGISRTSVLLTNPPTHTACYWGMQSRCGGSLLSSNSHCETEALLWGCHPERSLPVFPPPAPEAWLRDLTWGRSSHKTGSS